MVKFVHYFLWLSAHFYKFGHLFFYWFLLLISCWSLWPCCRHSSIIWFPIILWTGNLLVKPISSMAFIDMSQCNAFSMTLISHATSIIFCGFDSLVVIIFLHGLYFPCCNHFPPWSWLVSLSCNSCEFGIHCCSYFPLWFSCLLLQPITHEYDMFLQRLLVVSIVAATYFWYPFDIPCCSYFHLCLLFFFMLPVACLAL